MEITKEKVREILYSYGIGAILDKKDEKIITALLQTHPNVGEKIGSGIEYIFVHDGSYGTQCFWIMRTDGTRIDFSFLSCFKKKQPDDFPKAARKAVEPSVKRFRETLPHEFTCPILGIPLTPTTCHIDHVAPLTFKEILRLFRKEYPFTDIEYDHEGIGVSFSDKDIEKEFIRFHDSIAVLRGISKKANLSLPKK